MTTVKQVPVQLRQFVVEQDYAMYTPINQAVWRYIMRQHLAFLRESAHEAYVNGLEASGISVERIPDVAHMNECLARFGWGAVVVDGVIPATVFMDFQAHGLLPVSVDIRSHEHVVYTPAPDIIHETAGHAPILADEKFAYFVKRFGEAGAKAFSSQADHEVYEATRLLSILKEDPTATPEQVAAAEADFAAKRAAVVELSEATVAGRLYWWTVEYGLIGPMDAPRIYGAGLLSSVGESKYCLTSAVEHLPFSLSACAATSFDITTYQPNLFVCESFDQLIEAVETFRAGLAFVVGGTVALERALRSANTATIVYASGLQVTGTLAQLRHDAAGEAVYVHFAGPTALAFGDVELPGQGKDYHREGFGSPVGPLEGGFVLETASDAELAARGIVEGARAELRFASGVEVEGLVKGVQREGGQVLLVAFEDCRVTLGDAVLFEPEWGTYDMAVGARIVSAYPGAADAERFGEQAYMPSETLTARPEISARERRLHPLYEDVRRVREQALAGPEAEACLASVVAQLDTEYPEDWLLRLEVLELIDERGLASELRPRVLVGLEPLKGEPETRTLIENGLALIKRAP